MHGHVTKKNYQERKTNFCFSENSCRSICDRKIPYRKVLGFLICELNNCSLLFYGMIDYCAERQYFKLRRGFYALVEQNPLRVPP